MQLEYFNDALGQNPPVLLVYGNDPEGAAVLRRTADELAAAEIGHQVRIDRLPSVRAVDDCSLVGVVGAGDIGVEPTESRTAFRCVLRRDSWLTISGLLEPFGSEAAASTRRHQYLSVAGPVLWVVSTERGW